MFQVVRNFLIGAVVTVALYYLLENARVDRAPRAEKFTADSSDRSASTSAPPADLYSFVFSDEKTPQELAFSYTNGLKASAAAGGGAGGGMGAPFQAYDNSTMFESFH
jgi:hypothetical protein